MLASLHLLLVLVIAWYLPGRLRLLRSFEGLPGYLLSLGLSLFLVNWGDFLIYAFTGLEFTYKLLSWAWLLGFLWYVLAPAARSAVGAQGERGGYRVAPPDLTSLIDFKRWNYPFLGLMVFFVCRACLGVVRGDDGHIWTNFNFIDTAVHLSVGQALLNASGFPPVDLDMAPFPLKYHFIPDFYLTHLTTLQLPMLQALIGMNVLSFAVLIGSLWACLDRWLRLSAGWIALGCLLVLFLNTSLINVLHHLILHTPCFNTSKPLEGLLLFPYFNFEYTTFNFLDPQRAIVFCFPVILLVLHAAFGPPGSRRDPRLQMTEEHRIGLACFLVCLLPLSHIVSFAVLGACLLPRALGNWRLFLRFRPWLWVLGLSLLGAQLYYLFYYGPPMNPAFSQWLPELPFDHDPRFPWIFHRLVFWLCTDGDYLFWGILLGVLAWATRLSRNRETAETFEPTRRLTGHWAWFLLVGFGCLVFVNLYRYSRDWGDSNKFVLFLNLGLVLVIVRALADWQRRSRVLAGLCTGLLAAICVIPIGWEHLKTLTAPHAKILMFSDNALISAEWMRTSIPKGDVVITAAFGDHHMVSALAGRPVPAGIYSEFSPYLQPDRAPLLRKIYEEADLGAAYALKARYIVITRHERRVYKLNAKWIDWMRLRTGVVFNSDSYMDGDSVYIFSLEQLRLQSQVPTGARP